MWEQIKRKFDRFPSQLEVAKTFLRLGISVKDGRAFCDNIELVPTKIASALDVDRKVVVSAIENIEKDEELKAVYGSIKPVAEISEVSKVLGYPVLEVFADSMETGIVANITGIIARNNISIRYVLAEDPEISVVSKLTLITNEKIPGALVDEFLAVKGVKKIVVST
ncbi:MAG TPA: amino acid-binding ACT domain protein [Halobacteria archaeon]|nr:amino acid-binding ACT domain protein [Halobacteria archaeon]